MSGAFLCNNHRKRYIIYPKHNFVALKPRRRISKAQSGILREVKEVFRSPSFQEAIFPFMMFYRMDIVIPEYKLCVEYDSELHFKFIKHFHKTKANFKHRQKLDDVKAGVVEDNGWTVLRINYKEKNVKGKLKWMKNKIKKKRRLSK